MINTLQTPKLVFELTGTDTTTMSYSFPSVFVQVQKYQTALSLGLLRMLIILHMPAWLPFIYLHFFCSIHSSYSFVAPCQGRDAVIWFNNLD